MTAYRTIVHRADLTRAGDRMVIVFDRGGLAYRHDLPYRKSWSLRKYVATALADLDLTAGYDMTYGGGAP